MSATPQAVTVQRIDELAAYVARACASVVQSVHRRLGAQVYMRDLLEAHRDSQALAAGVDFDSCTRARKCYEELLALAGPDCSVDDVTEPMSEVTVRELGERVRFAEAQVALFANLNGRTSK